MRKKLTLALVMLALTPWAAQAQDAKAVLDGAVKAMGDVNSLQFSGSGAYFAFGQAYTPGAEWPRFGVKSYSRTVDYETPAMRDEYGRADGDPTARGGGAPLAPYTKATQAVSGNLAWNQVGENPPVAAPVAVADRLHQLWITPHGVLKAAAKNNAAVETKSDDGKKTTIVSFAVPDLFKARATVNDKNLVDKVKSWSTDPVLGDTLTETVYADYKDFGGVQFPTKISQKRGGQPTLDLTITEAKANVPADIKAPDSVAQAAVKVQADKVADGVWYLTGGTHHSVLVEMSDHLIVIEGPQNDARAVAVIEEAKKLVPNKPIKYVVNTHKHFDHAGGLAAFAADGAIVDHARRQQGISGEEPFGASHGAAGQARQVGQEAGHRRNAGEAGPERRHAHRRAASDPGHDARRRYHHGVSAEGKAAGRGRHLYARAAQHGASGNAESNQVALNDNIERLNSRSIRSCHCTAAR